MPATLYPVRSNEATDFLAGLATNAASVITNLPIPTPGVRRWFLRALSVVGLEAIAPEFNFFSSATGINADPALDNWIGAVGVLDTDAKRFGAAGVFRWWKDGLSIPLYDNDSANQIGVPSLHVALANRAVAAKTAGAPGNLQVTFWLEPITGGY
jgi:hypothetical protein